MKRSLIKISSGVCIVLALVAMWRYTLNYQFDQDGRMILSPWTRGALPVGLLLSSIALILWAENDAWHEVKSGTVISHGFTPAYLTAVTHLYNEDTNQTIGGDQVKDHWGLKIEDKFGNTNWIYFSTDPFSQHPLGSHYPGK